MTTYVRTMRARISGGAIAWCVSSVWMSPISCGGSVGGSPPDGGSFDADSMSQACANLATQECDAGERCTPEYEAIVFVDRSDCVARRTLGCEAQAALPGVGATVASVQACADGVKAFAGCPWIFSDSFATGFDGHSVHPVDFPVQACAPLWRGTLDMGVPCADDSQCKSGFCAGLRSKPSCGTCTPRAQLGDTCGTTPCDDGLFCHFDTHGKGSCETQTPRGGPCPGTSYGGCGGGLACVQHHCAEPLPVGASCDPLGEECDYDGRFVECDPYSKKCTSYFKGIAVQPVGGTCDPGFCGPGSYCQCSRCQDGGCSCEKQHDDGEKCNDYDKGPAVLVDAPRASSCRFDASCESGSCSTRYARCG